MDSDAVIRGEIERNVYRMREVESGVCVDIGAHTGYFTVDALRRGFHTVVSFEADHRNFVGLVERLNCRNHHAFWGAMWRGDYDGFQIQMRYQWGVDGENTGAGSVAVGDNHRETVPVFKLPLYHIDFLKLDCEGAEYAILYTSDLSNIQRIAMEIHFGIEFVPEAIVDGKNNTVEGMVSHLESRGFLVEVFGSGVRTAYLFARRLAAPAFSPIR